jgi:hypothetical protein
MRCADCNKFTGLETQDPEIDIDIDNFGSISGSVTIRRECSECGNVLKEGIFDIDHTINPADIPAEDHDHSHSLEVEEVSSEITSAWAGSKNLIGYSLLYRVICSECDASVEGTLEDSQPASAFDEV